MTPGARLAAVIELYGDIEQSFLARGQAADRIATDFFRVRRYAGSKDRRFIRDMVWTLVRQRALLLAMLEKAGLSASPRTLLLAHLVLHAPDLVPEFGADGPHAPDGLSHSEEKALEAIEDMVAADFSVSRRFGVPDWAEAGLRQRFGERFLEAAEGLQTRAPLDIRLNPLVATELADDLSEQFDAIDGLPGGFTSVDQVRIDQHSAFRDGAIEVQDRAAQLASLLVGAEPGMQVVDFCAGAGGKSLAMAAQMRGQGQVHAFDVSAHRLSTLRKRSDRARAHNVQTRTLGAVGTDDALKALEGKADRVVLDVPCSGVGTWRRNPDQRWRMSEAVLAGYLERQDEILVRAAPLVRVGGLLVYMTCSLLPDENEDRVAAFLDGPVGGGFTRVDLRQRFERARLSSLKENWALVPGDICLSPHSHAADGFFIACLERLDA